MSEKGGKDVKLAVCKEVCERSRFWTLSHELAWARARDEQLEKLVSCPGLFH